MQKGHNEAEKKGGWQDVDPVTYGSHNQTTSTSRYQQLPEFSYSNPCNSVMQEGRNEAENIGSWRVPNQINTSSHNYSAASSGHRSFHSSESPYLRNSTNLHYRNNANNYEFRCPHYEIERHMRPPPPGFFAQPDKSQVHHSHLPRPIASGVFELTDNDVLCGRGAPTAWHPGNQYFRSVVKTHRTRYVSSKRKEKPLIAMQVLDEIRSRGGKFLKRYKGGGARERGNFVWVEIGDQQAYEKVCQALREGTSTIRRQMQSSMTSTNLKRGDVGESNNSSAKNAQKP